ncbi:Respiratory nitrate reductase delta chain (EC [Olavius algarvensis associated proteobacterium Delta 3]|nr:Respiratory nitrate reductase delta chain (EC [Olavius algarvensis associated proteobacterium Delta 3]CAB5133236.1 Respiratory nitrate reductase delta chain (EC [Olavius algarvensis associated proteobacterium Delta 3]
MNLKERYLKLLSILLDYPDEGFLNGLPEVGRAVAHLPEGEQRSSLDAFLQEIRSLSPIRAQERYTSIFDLTPSTTLSMTYHQCGDGEKRAGVLAQLQQVYGCSGYTTSSGDLPDYLPMILEFLSLCPEAPGQEVLWNCLEPLNGLIGRLRETAPSYAALLMPLEGVRKEATDGPAPPGMGDRHP